MLGDPRAAGLGRWARATPPPPQRRAGERGVRLSPRRRPEAVSVTGSPFETLQARAGPDPGGLRCVPTDRVRRSRWRSAIDTSPGSHAGRTRPSPTPRRRRSSTPGSSAGSSRTRCRRGPTRSTFRRGSTDVWSRRSARARRQRRPMAKWNTYVWVEGASRRPQRFATPAAPSSWSRSTSWTRVGWRRSRTARARASRCGSRTSTRARRS